MTAQGLFGTVRPAVRGHITQAPAVCSAFDGPRQSQVLEAAKVAALREEHRDNPLQLIGKCDRGPTLDGSCLRRTSVNSCRNRAICRESPNRESGDAKSGSHGPAKETKQIPVGDHH